MIMKKYFLYLAFTTFAINLNAQLYCGYNSAFAYLKQISPNVQFRFDSLMKLAEESQHHTNKSAVAAYTIPVVFHVLHLNGSENISDAQINSAMICLNEDFQKLNADAANIVPEFTATAADCEIKFVLASKDENGNCTNGITRHYTSLTNWTTNAANYLYTWNPQKYMNVYVVKSMGNGAAGYTFLPGTVGGSMDAIVMLHDYVGKIGTSSLFKSHTLSHEAGHWFNLQHVWGSNNNPGVTCGDDGVSDTPITKGWQSCSLSNPIICSPGIKENVQNFMEYSYCSNMFTVGQKNRMHNALNSPIGGRNNLSSNTNLIATGLINPTLNCAPIAEFRTTNSVTCVGSSLSFFDQSYNATVTNWNWSSNLSSNTSTTANGSLTFTNSGIAAVKLKVNNSYGSDSITKSYVVVMAALTSTNVGTSQSFEQGVFPNTNWIVTNAQYGGTFNTYTNTAATGTNCAWVNNYFDSPGGMINLYTPSYLFDNQSPATFEFKYAYAQTQTGNNDRLRVLVSPNCGATWNVIFNRTGNLLNTTGTTYIGAFLNPFPQEWQTISIDVSSYANQGIYFKFEYTPDANAPGNNLFIDDIYLNAIPATVGIKNDPKINNFKMTPNPAQDLLNISSSTPIENIEIYSLDGKLIQKKQFVSPVNNQTIMLSNLSKGMYFIKVNSTTSKKLIIE